MIPWTLLDTAPVPGGEGELRLRRRGAEFSITARHGRADEQPPQRLGGGARHALLRENRCARRSRASSSAGSAWASPCAPRWACSGRKAQIVVAELVPAVVAWARGPMAELFGDSLTDPRVRIEEEDVGRVIRAGRGSYDAILLDVDNGPEALHPRLQ